jgi:hypothetical protein
MNLNNILKKINFRSDYALIIYLALFKIIIHLINPEYGYHRDELFFLDIGNHYSFSNLDVLPLTPLYIKFITLLFGHSLKAVHFASSLCGAISIVLTCLITKELGGKRFAILLAGLSTLFSGFLIFGALFTYDSLDFLIVVTIIYLLVRLFKEDKPIFWVFIGIVIGFGLLNKLTILFFCLSIFMVLLITPYRKYLKNRWIWIAVSISLILFMPFLVWQFNHDWYFINWANYYAGGNSYIASFPEFLWNQILPNNVINVPIWITGLTLLIFSKKWKQYRFFGYNYIFLFLLIYMLGGKFYFLIPYYTILLAVGSIKVEEWIHMIRIPARKIFLLSIPVVYFMLSLVTVPMMMPILPVQLFPKYAAMLGMGNDAGVQYENNPLNDLLPQHFSDRFGWEEMTEIIAQVYHSIPESEKNEVGIFTNNSGQSAAINFYREKYGLPEAISAHGWYYFHEERMHDFKKIYVLVGDDRGVKDLFKEEEQKTLFTHPYCMPYENNKTIEVCKYPKGDFMQLWKTLKH